MTDYYGRDGDDPIDVRCLSRRYVSHARKEHRCSTCGGPIHKGVPYRREVWLIDGEFVTYRYHRTTGHCLPEYVEP